MIQSLNPKSRRTSSWTRLFIFAATILLAGLVYAESEPIKVLVITGGCCHDYSAQKNLIKHGLEARANFEVTVVQQGGNGTFAKIPLYENPNWADPYDVVIHDECFADVKDTAWIQRILKPHQEGKPAVVVHCAMHCYRDGTDNWFKFCGVTSRGHGAHYAHEVLNRDATHPVMKDWGAAWSNPAGELYAIEKIWPTAHGLASAKDRASGKEQICVWTNQYGKARVFGTTLGHHNETVSHPKFLDLLTRGTLWACNKLDENYKDYEVPVAEPKLVPNNLALNKSVTASSQQDGNLVSYAGDDKSTTRWCASDSSAPQWIQIDLGEEQQVTGCKLAWEHAKRATYRYVVEGSNDATNWNSLVDYSDNEGNNYEHKFESKLRFLRVRFLHATGGMWGSLWEVKVHGTKLVESTRSEATQPLAIDLQLPAGLSGQIFAAPPTVNYPVSVCAAPDGTVYVCVDKNGSLDREPNRGAIMRLRDINADGVADESKLFVDNVDSPRCAVWDHDRLYVMHPPHLSAFIDHDGDGHADEQKVLVKNIAFGFEDRPADHTSNGVTLGIDGWLYLAIGDFGFMKAEGTDGRQLQFRGGGVIRVRPDGTGLEVYARGTRNILEVAMDPLLSGFTRDNTNDGGGWDIRIHHFSGLEHHGYPSLYMNFSDEAVAPLADYGGGSGCGALFLAEPGYPKALTNVICTADWGRNKVFSHRLKSNGASFTIDQQPMINITRATDLDVDAHSNIYAASWRGSTFTYAGEDVGHIVKISPDGFKPPPLPDFANASMGVLLETLKSPSHRRRLEAQRAIVRRGLDESATLRMQNIAANSDLPLPTRVAAIFGLKQALGTKSHTALIALANNQPSVRAWAIRALADRWDQIDSTAVAAIQQGLSTHDDPRTLLESIVAAARQGDTLRLAPLVADLLADKDPLIAHTAIQSLVKLRAINTALAIIDDSSVSSEKQVAALRVLHNLHDQRVVKELISRLDHNANPESRFRILTTLCRLAHREGEWKGNSWGTRPDTSGPYYQPEEWEMSESIKSVLSRALEQTQGDAVRDLIVSLNRHKIRLPELATRLLKLSAEDKGMIPLTIEQIDRSGQFDQASLDFLSGVANNDQAELTLRISATRTWLKSGDDSAWPAALDLAKPAVETFGAASSEYRVLRRSFLQARGLRSHLSRLATLAAKNNGVRSEWADCALVSFSKMKDAKTKSAAQAALDEGWMNTQRRQQIINAVDVVDARNFESKIREAMKDPDAAIATAANRLAKQWNLEPKPTPAARPIKSMRFEDVMAAAANLNGNADHGATVYARLDCKKCHTVQAGEELRGPYLPNVAKTYKRGQIAEAILKPSKSLAQGFATTLFYLDNGKTATGFITKESAEEVVYRDNEGTEHRLDADRIEERMKQQISLMPEGQVDQLSIEDFAALLSYLQSLGK